METQKIRVIGSRLLRIHFKGESIWFNKQEVRHIEGLNNRESTVFTCMLTLLSAADNVRCHEYV